MPDNLQEIARNILIDCAKKEKLITYSDLVRKIRSVIPIDIGPHDLRLFQLLGEISIEEDRNNRGMLSVVVIREVDQRPGPGFFKLAEQLGKIFSDSEKEEFWIAELKKVFDYWGNRSEFYVMTEDSVLGKVKDALQKFLENEGDLFEIGVNERSISHKVAEYLQYEFSDMKVDCEYNRHGLELDPKRIKGRKDQKKNIYPDIVVHKRGVDTNNILVVEIKNHNDSPRYLKDLDWDRWKLQELTKELSNYRYQNGLLIEFDTQNKKIYKIERYKKGEKVENDLSALKEISCDK